MPQMIDLCATSDIELEDVIRIDRDGHSFAVYRSPGDKFRGGWPNSNTGISGISA